MRSRERRQSHYYQNAQGFSMASAGYVSQYDRTHQPMQPPPQMLRADATQLNPRPIVTQSNPYLFANQQHTPSPPTVVPCDDETPLDKLINGDPYMDQDRMTAKQAILVKAYETFMRANVLEPFLVMEQELQRLSLEEEDIDMIIQRYMEKLQKIALPYVRMDAYEFLVALFPLALREEANDPMMRGTPYPCMAFFCKMNPALFWYWYYLVCINNQYEIRDDGTFSVPEGPLQFPGVFYAWLESYRDTDIPPVTANRIQQLQATGVLGHGGIVRGDALAHFSTMQTLVHGIQSSDISKAARDVWKPILFVGENGRDIYTYTQDSGLWETTKCTEGVLEKFDRVSISVRSKQPLVYSQRVLFAEKIVTLSARSLGSYMRTDGFLKSMIDEDRQKRINVEMHLVSFKTCVLDAIERVIRLRRPDDFLSTKLPYDPIAADVNKPNDMKICRDIHKYFMTLFSNNKTIHVFLQIMASVFHFPRPQQKMYFLQGNTSNGKTTLTQLMNRLYGSEQVTFAKSDIFQKCASQGGASPHLAHVVGKHYFIIINEFKPDEIDIGQFKEIVGGDEIAYRRLYGPIEQGFVKGVILAPTNSKISIDNADNATLRRLAVVLMENTFTDDDALINWVNIFPIIPGIQRMFDIWKPYLMYIIAQISFVYNGKANLTTSMNKTAEKQLFSNDPKLMFFHDCTIKLKPGLPREVKNRLIKGMLMVTKKRLKAEYKSFYEDKFGDKLVIDRKEWTDLTNQLAQLHNSDWTSRGLNGVYICDEGFLRAELGPTFEDSIIRVGRAMEDQPMDVEEDTDTPSDDPLHSKEQQKREWEERCERAFLQSWFHPVNLANMVEMANVHQVAAV
ncbi:MAG: hypothetical protein AAFO91_00200 [Bacteroidota bacterium]